MKFGLWDGMATGTAGLALVALALLPREPQPLDVDSGALRSAGQAALELGNNGTAVAFEDNGSGLSGSIMPLRVFRNAEGQWCRRFVITVDGRGGPVAHSRTACRRLNGEWQTQVEAVSHQVAEVGR